MMELCTLFEINIAPKNMSAAELQSGFLKRVKQLCSAEETSERRTKLKRMLRTSPDFGWRAMQREQMLAV